MFKIAFHPDIFCPFRRSFYRWQISFPFIIRLETYIVSIAPVT